MTVYLTRGANLLPQALKLDDLYKTNLTSNAQSVRSIDEGNYQLPTVDKMVKRVSNAQSRWLLWTGINSWDLSLAQEVRPEQRGLFLGLGTSDADDTIDPVAFDANTTDDYINQVTTQMQPMIGLTLLNSSSASHLAQHLDIQGDNGFFSPHSDAGAIALIEGYYSIFEKHAKLALCGGGSQKISTWYKLSYAKLLDKYKQLTLSEAASFVTLHSNANYADAKISHVQRTFIHHKNDYYRLFESLKNRASHITQVIHAGLASQIYQQFDDLQLFFPNVYQFNIDRQLGYVGPASAFIALNLAIKLKQNQLIVRNINEIESQNINSDMNTLIVIHSDSSCIAVLVNFNIKD